MEDFRDVLRTSLSTQGGFPPRDPIYRLALWVVLQKLGVIGLKKHTVTLMATFVNGGVQGIIPEGAYQMPVIGTSFEYVYPVKRKQGNWPDVVF